MLLNELKKGTSIILLLLLAVLLVIPLYAPVYYVGMYYLIMIVAVIPLVLFRLRNSELREKRFYARWKERRKKGRFFNVFISALQTIFLGLVVTLGSQFIVNGRTPSYILSKLPKTTSMGLMFFFLVIGVLTGIAAWYENEKRFKKISRNLKEYE